jgi:hypothetical protein
MLKIQCGLSWSWFSVIVEQLLRKCVSDFRPNFNVLRITPFFFRRIWVVFSDIMAVVLNFLHLLLKFQA